MCWVRLTVTRMFLRTLLIIILKDIIVGISMVSSSLDCALPNANLSQASLRLTAFRSPSCLSQKC
jgi:hypothetical protein